MFVYEQDALAIAGLMEETQGKIPKFYRDIMVDPKNKDFLESKSDPMFSQEAVGESLRPIHIESIPYNHLEKLCIFHHFDMLIAYHHRIVPEDSDEYKVHLDCYEYITEELPNRILQEKIFRDMLYPRDDT